MASAFLRSRSALLLLSLASAAPLAAQLPPLTIPKGLVRLELAGRFDNWDRQFFGGVKRDAAGDWLRDPADGTWLPELGMTEAKLREVTGVQALSLSVGKTTGRTLVNVGTEYLGLGYGVTRRLTVFGTLPWVRVRVQNQLRVDSTTATAGFNPAHPVFGTIDGAGGTATFLGLLNSALTSLDGLIQSQFYDTDPVKKALAIATLAEGLALQQKLQDVLLSSVFLPLSGSSAATAFTTSLDAFRAKLLAVDVPGFNATPSLPTDGIGASALEDFATNSESTVKAQPFEPPILRAIGDIEVGASFLWLDRKPAAPGGLVIRSVLTGTVRLRTGQLDQPDALFDLPSGDRQPDLQGDLVTDLGSGRLGARVTARYVVQFPGRQTRRLTPPDQPLAPVATLAAVERNPGEIVEGALEPWFRIAPHFSVVAGVRHWRKDADRYRYVPNQDSIPGTTPDVLAQGSKANGTTLSAGLSFSHDGVRADGRTGMPIDAMLRGELVVGSGLGRVPVTQSISIMLRLYRKLF